MRKVYGPDFLGQLGGKSTNSFALVVFLCFANHSQVGKCCCLSVKRMINFFVQQFCVLRPMRNDGQWQLDHLSTIFTPDFDLIDFSVTPAGHLMALWTNPDGFPVLRYARFAGPDHRDTAGSRWTAVTLEEPINPDFQPLGVQADPRQAYLQQLFYPGRFSMQTLAKTVSIYRRSSDLALVENMTVAKLREEVCSAVETEIHNQVTEIEITDEEHIEISHAAWAR